MTEDRPKPSGTIVIIGAGGYLGGMLCHLFHALPSCEVVALFRGKPNHGAFARAVVADAFLDEWSVQLHADAQLILINCAFDFKAIGEGKVSQKYEVFERNIASLCRRQPTKLINISTMSAYPGCRTDYGREKLFVEELFRRYGEINVRPGLVVSWRRPGAAFLNLIEMARAAKVFPVLQARNSGFHICDVEAVVLGIYLLAGARLNKSHTLSFCYRERLGLLGIVRMIEARFALRRIKIPVPWRLAYPLLLVKELLLGRSKIRADSVLDFAHPLVVAFRRGAFARIVDQFRSELARLSGAESGAGGFYFLEPPSAGQSTTRNCAARGDLGEVIAALGELPDTHRVG